MAKREYFRRPYKTIGKTGIDPDIYDEKAPDGCEIHYQRIIIHNLTTNVTDMFFLVDRAGTMTPIGSIRDAPQTYATVYDGAEIVIQGNEVFVARWMNTVAGDDLTVVFEGYLWSKS